MTGTVPNLKSRILQMIENYDLKRLARAALSDALAAVDAERAVADAVCMNNYALTIGGRSFPIDSFDHVYAIALGKAAFGMFRGLNASIGELIKEAVISCPRTDYGSFKVDDLSQIFHGGHPLPNEDSLAAARSSLDLLARADSRRSLVLFLVSGGGSSMMELPESEKISLSDLRKTNEMLVGCGAPIGEINAIRRRISSIKGGGLSRRISSAAFHSFIISDTNDGEAHNVASGPTITPTDEFSAEHAARILDKYDLRERLPKSVVAELVVHSGDARFTADKAEQKNWSVLLENSDAVFAASESLKHSGLLVKTAADIVEGPIEEGCRQLADRLCSLREANPQKPVALISGGEFSCPVRGNGVGGRSLETALRTAIIFDELAKQPQLAGTRFLALFAGTDGIDGNSPAAGAICDESTVARGSAQGMSAVEFLNKSDSHTYLSTLGDAIVTGPTGTNVRDLRILIAA